MSDRSKALILYADDVEIIVDTVTPWISMTGVADPDRGLGAGLSPECWRQMGDACRRAADRQEAIERGTPESIAAPADSTKPAACGACGGEVMIARASPNGRATSRVFCLTPNCRVEGPIRDADTMHEAVSLAIAAWNRMWAPRAGEATEYVMGRIQLALKAADNDCNYLEIRDERGPKLGVFIKVKRAVLALAELGLTGGEGRG